MLLLWGINLVLWAVIPEIIERLLVDRQVLLNTGITWEGATKGKMYFYIFDVLRRWLSYSLWFGTANVLRVIKDSSMASDQPAYTLSRIAVTIGMFVGFLITMAAVWILFLDLSLKHWRGKEVMPGEMPEALPLSALECAFPNSFTLIRLSACRLSTLEAYQARANAVPSGSARTGRANRVQPLQPNQIPLETLPGAVTMGDNQIYEVGVGSANSEHNRTKRSNSNGKERSNSRSNSRGKERSSSNGRERSNSRGKERSNSRGKERSNSRGKQRPH